MRLKLGNLSFLPLALALVAGGLSVPADAGSRHRDRIYADSFGNLVIHSRNGYKRIIVGAGHRAKELAGYEETGEDDGVIYFDDDDVVLTGDCWKPAVLLKGRSYMYGLEDGELPDLPGKCR
jgi:hypothetical protein